jgi:putative hemolysin
LITLPTELLILLSLVVANGLLSMAETGVVASRKAKLQERADEGDASAGRALELKAHPQRFLALVQFWLTLSGMIAGVLGGARLAGKLDTWLAAKLESWVALGETSSTVAFALVTIGLTSFMLLFGELVPKRIALAYPERAAALLAGSMRALAWLAAPFLKVLELATEGVLALIRFKAPKGVPEVSNDEVRALIEQGLHAGSFNQVEQRMVTGVLELDELSVTVLMTPRPKIVFLNLDDSDEVNWRKIVTSGHSRFPVYQSNRDQVIGVVAVKAIWANSAFGLSTHLRNLVAPALTVPVTMTAIQLLEQFKKTGQHLALVADEFGAVEGLVTLLDVLTAIVGDLPERGRHNQPEARRREDGSLLVDATLPTVEVKVLLELDELEGESEANYQTLAGFVMTQFGRIPRAGDHFDYAGWRFEVMDMDRQRIDKMLVSKVPPPARPLEQEAG